MVTEQIQSMIPISPMFRLQDPRTLVKLYSTKAKFEKKKKKKSLNPLTEILCRAGIKKV